MRRRASGFLGFTVLAIATAACAVDTTGEIDTRSIVVSQGVVVGFVRDTAGQPVANATVCATATFSSGGPLTITSTLSKSESDGGYVVPLSLAIPVNAQAHLTVAATPAPGSGLEAGYTSGLLMAITTALPPADTTHADVAVVHGTPPVGVFCTAGP